VPEQPCFLIPGSTSRRAAKTPEPRWGTGEAALAVKNGIGF